MVMNIGCPRLDTCAVERRLVERSRSFERDDERRHSSAEIIPMPPSPISRVETPQNIKESECKRQNFLGKDSETENTRRFWSFGHRKHRDHLGNNRLHAAAERSINSEELTKAVLKGRVKEVCKLLNGKKSLVTGNRGAPANPDSVDGEGFRALFLAVQRNHLEIVRALIEHGANPNLAGNLDGVTPLCLAAGEGNEAATMILIGKGACVDIPAKGGVTPLIMAAQNGHVTIVRELLTRVVNVDHRTSKGHTPLSCAIRNCHLEIVNMLVAAGAKHETSSIPHQIEIELPEPPVNPVAGATPRTKAALLSVVHRAASA